MIERGTVVTEPADTAIGAAPAGGGEPPVRHCGRYEVVGMLGQGGMGIVLEARDPALDRRVALKLLHPGRRTGGGDARRLALEAQAMARLAHPNVVTVFESDRVDDQIYVAMELVAGTTLRGWLRASERNWREIVDMFVAAGHGLAAAHAAGLVHRDFKPDNVLIGSDGRPRVTDFGLVVATPDEAGLGDGDADDIATTLRGSAAGTPAYMSPEQWSGAPLDARSDQFAFCVALWEALCGRRPFVGIRPHELRDSVRHGASIDLHGRQRAPSWLFAMLRRGLARDPAQRWPDLPALLAAIAHRRSVARRRKITAAIAGLGIASAVIATALAGAHTAPDPCAPPTARLAAAWGPARSDALRAHLAAVDPAQGASRFAKIAAALDAGARGWSDMHVAACRATRVDGEQSDALLDQRMECLDRWLVELADTAGAIAQAADPVAVDKGVHAATSLSPLDACGDAVALAGAPLPVGAAERAKAIALADRTREVTVAERAGRFDGLASRAAALVADARALGHAPTLAGALMAQSNVLFGLGEHLRSAPILRELIDVAARAHDTRAEAYAWMRLASTTALAGKLDEAVALIAPARAAVARAGDPVALRADLLYQQAIALHEGPRWKESVAFLEEDRRLLESAGANQPGSPLAERLGDALLESGRRYLATDLDAAMAMSRRAIDLWRAIAGVDSANEGIGWLNLANALQRSGKLDDALAAVRQSSRIFESRQGPSLPLALSLTFEAAVFDEQGRWDQSIGLYDRALAMSRAKIGADDQMLSHPLLDRGVALFHLARYDEAVASYEEGIALLERTGGQNVNLPIAFLNRAEVRAAQGRCADAIRDDLHALALLEQLRAPEYLRMYGLSGQGACLVRTGRAPEAIPILQRAMAYDSSGADAFEVARVRSYLGRALVETGRDVAGGLAMARAARVEIAAAPVGAEELRMLDRWLASRRAPVRSDAQTSARGASPK